MYVRPCHAVPGQGRQEEPGAPEVKDANLGSALCAQRPRADIREETYMGIMGKNATQVKLVQVSILVRADLDG